MGVFSYKLYRLYIAGCLNGWKLLEIVSLQDWSPWYRSERVRAIIPAFIFAYVRESSYVRIVMFELVIFEYIAIYEMVMFEYIVI